MITKKRGVVLQDIEYIPVMVVFGVFIKKFNVSEFRMEGVNNAIRKAYNSKRFSNQYIKYISVSASNLTNETEHAHTYYWPSYYAMVSKECQNIMTIKNVISDYLNSVVKTIDSDLYVIISSIRLIDNTPTDAFDNSVSMILDYPLNNQRVILPLTSDDTEIVEYEIKYPVNPWWGQFKVSGITSLINEISTGIHNSSATYIYDMEFSHITASGHLVLIVNTVNAAINPKDLYNDVFEFINKHLKDNHCTITKEINTIDYSIQKQKK